MWQEEDKKLHREFKFKDFKEAFNFMSKVADVAEVRNHHPRWTNEYNKVDIWLTTHSEVKITDKDHALAKEIDKLYENTKI